MNGTKFIYRLHSVLKSLGVVSIVMLSLSLWLVIFTIGLFAISGFDACVMDDCGPDQKWWENVLILIALLGPPILISVFWILSAPAEE